MIPQWEQDIINAREKEYVFKIEFLSKDEKVLDEVTIDVIGGNANFNGTKSCRRSASITLKNLKGEYTPSNSGKLWINNKIKLKAGYKYNGNQELLYNQGVYVLGNPSIFSSPTRKEITLQLLDKWCLLDGTISGELKNKLIIPVDTRVDEAIRSVINLTDETKYIIDECTTVLPYTIEKQSGETIASILEEICNIVSYEIFYDQNGYLRFRKALKVEDLEITPVSWKYTTDYSIRNLVLELYRDLHWNDIKNSVKVLGDVINGVQISAIAQNFDDPDFGINTIGERFLKIEDSNIFTNELAQQRADYELQKKIMLAETVKIPIEPNFSEEVGNVVEFTDSNSGASGNYVIQTIDYDFSYDAVMNLGIWRIKSI